MKTTASNQKLRVLLLKIENGSLDTSPKFQRRSVWTNKDKLEFIQTVLKNYPFPEIYIASGSVDIETGEGKELLVDGQQRMTTLYQYFKGDPVLKLNNKIKPYKELSEKQKEHFFNMMLL